MSSKYFRTFSKFLSGDFQDFADLLICYEVAKLANRLLYGEANHKTCGVFMYAKQLAFAYTAQMFKKACLSEQQLTQVASVCSKVRKIYPRAPYRNSTEAKKILDFLRVFSVKDCEDFLPHIISQKCKDKKLSLKEPLYTDEQQFVITEEGIKPVDQLDDTFLFSHHEMIEKVNPFLGQKTMREPILDIESYGKKTKLTNTIDFLKDSINSEISRKTQDIFAKPVHVPNRVIQAIPQNLILAETMSREAINPSKNVFQNTISLTFYGMSNKQATLTEPQNFVIPFKKKEPEMPKEIISEGEMILRKVGRFLKVKLPDDKSPALSKQQPHFLGCSKKKEIAFSILSNKTEEISTYTGFGSLLHNPLQAKQLSKKTKKRIQNIRKNIFGLKTSEENVENNDIKTTFEFATCTFSITANEQIKPPAKLSIETITYTFKTTDNKKFESVIVRETFFMIEKEFKDEKLEEQIRFSGISAILRSAIPSLLECIDRVFFAYGDFQPNGFLSRYRYEELPKFPSFVKNWLRILDGSYSIAETSTYWSEPIPYDFLKEYLSNSKDLEILFMFLEKINCKEHVESVLSYGASIAVIENVKYAGNQRLRNSLLERKETELMFIAEKANKLKMEQVLNEVKKEYISFKKILKK